MLTLPMAPPAMRSFVLAVSGDVFALAAHHHQFSRCLLGGDDRLAFLETPRHRLLNVDMLSGGERVEYNPFVQMVRSSDHDGVDILAVKNLAVILRNGDIGGDLFLGALEEPS